MKMRITSRGLFTGLLATTALTPIAVWADEAKTDSPTESKAVLFQPLPAGHVGNLPESEIISATWKTDPAPELKAFAKWVDQFLPASPEEKLELEAAGVKLAKARLAVIKEQILSDPRRALANAVPIAVRKRLPDQVVRYLEKRVDTFTDWGTECSMPVPETNPDGSLKENAEANTKTPAQDASGHALEATDTEVAEVGGRTFKAHHYGDRTARFVQGGSLHGIAIDNELAVLDSPLRALEPGEEPRGNILDFNQVSFGQKGGKNQAAAQRELNAQIAGGAFGHSVEGGGTASGSTTGGFANGGFSNDSNTNSGGSGISSSTGNGVSSRFLRFYQIGGSVYGKSSDAGKTEVVEASFKARQNGYRNLRETISSGDGWKPSEDKQALGDSGVPGSTGMQGRPPVSHTHGTKTVLIIRAQSPGHMLDPWLLNQTNLNNQAADINTRYGYISKNRLNITFTYTPVYTFDASYDNFNADTWHDAARARAQSDGYNLNNYHVHALMHGPANTGYGGLMSANKMWLNNTFGQFVFIHEFGHYLSLPHAGLFQTTDGNPMSPSKTNIPYGDGYCYMGGSYNAYNLGLYAPAYMSKLRWMYEEDIQTVTRSGTYTFHQYDGTVDHRLLALKVPRNSETNYWLSLRGNVDAGGVLHSQGVAIRAQNAWNPNDSILVDMHPNDGGSENAPLGVGETWYDSAADLTIKTISVQGTTPNRSITVQITFGPLHNAAYRPLVNGGIYRFANRANPAVSISGVAGGANAPIVAASSSDTNALQQWVANRNADGTYSFNLLGTGKWIDFYGGVYTVGSDIYQHDFNGSDAQKLYVTETPDGYISFGHRNSEGNTAYALDMWTANNDIRQWSWDGGIPNAAPQQWKPELIGLSTGKKYRVLPQSAQAQALDVNGTNPNNGSPVTIHTWHGGNNQQWNFESVTGGFRFRSQYSTTRVLDVNVATTNLAINDVNGGANQRFTLTRSGGNWVRIVPGYNTGNSIEATGGTANGTPVTSKPENGGSNQRWRFADTDG